MKKVIISIIVCCSLFGLKAQNTYEPEMKNMVFYTEFGGPGVLFSANLDGRFNPESKLGLGYRVGLGFAVKLEDEYYDYYDYSSSYRNKHGGPKSYGTVPVGINYLFGREYSPNVFEIGAGLTLLTKKVSLYNWDNDYSDPGNFIGHATLMYRRQPLNGGFTFRIGFMTVVGTGGDFLPSAAIGFGYAF